MVTNLTLEEVKARDFPFKHKSGAPAGVRR